MGENVGKFNRKPHYYPLGAYDPVEGMHINTRNKEKRIYGPTCKQEQIDMEALLA